MRAVVIAAFLVPLMCRELVVNGALPAIGYCLRPTARALQQGILGKIAEASNAAPTF